MKNHTHIKNSFLGFFIVFVLVLLVVVVGALRLVWLIAEDYEASIPLSFAQTYADLIEQKNYPELMSAANIELSPFEDETYFATFMDKHLTGEQPKVQITRVHGKPEGEQGYKLMHDGKAIAEVIVARLPEKSRYGFEQWQLKGIQGIWQNRQKYTVLLPEGATLQINGKAFDAKAQEPKKLPVDAYATMPESVQPPFMNSYEIEGLLLEPQLQAKSFEGQDCTVNASGKILTVAQPAGAELEKTAKTYSEQMAMLYARFITKDAEFKELSACLLQGSGFYKQMATFYNGWYIEHDSYAFENMKTENVLTYGPDYFSCDVSFDYYILKGSKKHHYPSAYTLYFVKQNGRWVVANLLLR